MIHCARVELRMSRLQLLPLRRLSLGQDIGRSLAGRVGAALDEIARGRCHVAHLSVLGSLANRIRQWRLLVWAAIVEFGIVVLVQVLLLWHKLVHLLASLARVLSPLVQGRGPILLLLLLHGCRLHGRRLHRRLHGILHRRLHGGLLHYLLLLHRLLWLVWQDGWSCRNRRMPLLRLLLMDWRRLRIRLLLMMIMMMMMVVLLLMVLRVMGIVVVAVAWLLVRPARAVG